MLEHSKTFSMRYENPFLEKLTPTAELGYRAAVFSFFYFELSTGAEFNMYKGIIDRFTSFQYSPTVETNEYKVTIQSTSIQVPITFLMGMNLKYTRWVDFFLTFGISQKFKVYSHEQQDMKSLNPAKSSGSFDYEMGYFGKDNTVGSRINSRTVYLIRPELVLKEQNKHTWFVGFPIEIYSYSDYEASGFLFTVEDEIFIAHNADIFSRPIYPSRWSVKGGIKIGWFF